MKKILTLFAGAALVFVLTGCSTTAGMRLTPNKEGLAKRAVDAGLTLVIRNNPKYQPLALDVITRLDDVVARGYTNPDLFTEFLAEMQAKYSLGSDDLEKITRTVNQLRAAYFVIYGETFPVNIELSASAKTFINEVKTHIANAANLAVLFPKD